jgi:ubiquinone/menaquinone biosynthesis C-methylase UbiE
LTLAQPFVQQSPVAKTPAFEDHFSGVAADYARFRPHYPPELFDYLSAQAPAQRLAWDCGTGSGQAALELARRFERVYATDASAEQLAHAFPHPKIEYRAEPAEQPSLPDHSVDLITVAVAVHWFDFERFYAAVRRVAAPGGVLAVWTYHLPLVSPAVDRLLFQYYTVVLEGFWPERIRYLDERYSTLPFPFEELPAPGLHMQAHWDLSQLAGFMDSWSATQRYRAERGRHPLGEIWSGLEQAWGDPDRRRTVRFPLFLRAGRVG